MTLASNKSRPVLIGRYITFSVDFWMDGSITSALCHCVSYSVPKNRHLLPNYVRTESWGSGSCAGISIGLYPVGFSGSIEIGGLLACFCYRKELRNLCITRCKVSHHVSWSVFAIGRNWEICVLPAAKSVIMRGVRKEDERGIFVHFKAM